MGSPRLCYESLQPSPDTLTRFKGPTSKRREGEKGREMWGEDRKKRRAGERGGEVRLPHSKFLDPPLTECTGTVAVLPCTRQCYEGPCTSDSKKILKFDSSIHSAWSESGFHVPGGRRREGDKYRFWQLSQTTLFVTTTIRKIKRSLSASSRLAAKRIGVGEDAINISVHCTNYSERVGRVGNDCTFTKDVWK